MVEIWVKFNFLLSCHFYILQKMFNLNDITTENNKDHNLNGPYITNHPYRMPIIRGSGSEKTNALFNFKKEQDSDSLIDRFVCML